MIAHDRNQQYKYRTGLTWLNAHAERTLGQPFLKLSQEQQISLLEPLAYKAKYRPGEEDGREFFRAIREVTAMGFYSSEIGYKEIDNPALKFYAESPACPHTDDREHKHLPPAKWGAMAKQIYDVIVIGTGAGGGMAMKPLCEAGRRGGALTAGRRTDPVHAVRRT